MTSSQLANILQAALVAILCSAVLFGVLPRFRVDAYRQRMFEVRDELFDFAASGGISFKDPAYILLRQQMNALIRYGHQITLFRIGLTEVQRLLFGTPLANEWHESWRRSLNQVQSQLVRDQLMMFHSRAVTVAAKHLVFGSPLVMIVFLLAALVGVLREGYTGMRQLWRTVCGNVLTGPLDPTRLEEEAAAAA